MSAKPSLSIDIWSDIACPWCYIGTTTLKAALADYDGEVTITHHSFELAPDTPVDFEGSEIDFLTSHKHMPPESVQQMLDQVSATGASAGVEFQFERVQHTNTLRAHQALHHAAAHGKSEQLLERYFRAYFVQGRHLGRDEELADLASEVGLDRQEVLRDLKAERFGADVQRDIARANQLGISAVPFFVFAGKYGVSGAQSSQTFSQVLDQVAQEMATSSPVE